MAALRCVREIGRLRCLAESIRRISSIMPEPNYAGDDPPGFWVWLIGFAVLFVLFLLIQSC
jgi:hypothetical protein